MKGREWSSSGCECVYCSHVCNWCVSCGFLLWIYSVCGCYMVNGWSCEMGRIHNHNVLRRCDHITSTTYLVLTCPLCSPSSFISHWSRPCAQQSDSTSSSAFRWVSVNRSTTEHWLPDYFRSITSWLVCNALFLNLCLILLLEETPPPAYSEVPPVDSPQSVYSGGKYSSFFCIYPCTLSLMLKAFIHSLSLFPCTVGSPIMSPLSAGSSTTTNPIGSPLTPGQSG